jgi:hypothetical protein
MTAVEAVVKNNHMGLINSRTSGKYATVISALSENYTFYSRYGSKKSAVL